MGQHQVSMLPRAHRQSSFWMMVLCGLITLAVLALASKAGEDRTSPQLETDMICPTENPVDCYPRVFQPTYEFQVVHDDQELPHGLHVRLNVWTGLKEAKINVPDEHNPLLEGLPVDSAVVIVDPESEHVADALLPNGAPVYEAVGKVKTPQVESQSFYDALEDLKAGPMNGDETFDASLAVLNELSHDIYYGLKVAEDTKAVKALFCMMTTEDVFMAVKDEICIGRAGQAASIVGAALQNNPTALHEIEQAWTELKATICPGSEDPLGWALFNTLLPDPRIEDENIRQGDGALALIKPKASALNWLIKSNAIRRDFLTSKGMSQILRVLVTDVAQLDSTKRRLAKLVLDNFLDENMGASLGEWPPEELLGEETCRHDTPGSNELCWDQHLQKLATKHEQDGDHWSQELWNSLSNRRAAMRGHEHDEL